MHLIYKNVLKNLVLLWTGDYKGLNEGSESYKFNPGVWDAIGAATAASGSLIPGAFGTQPRNVADDKSTCTADMWSFWMLYIGPILLAQNFEKLMYYNHFIKLVKLINLCLQFELQWEEISAICTEFKSWVEKYKSRSLIDCLKFLKSNSSQTILSVLALSTFCMSIDNPCSASHC